MDTNTIFTLLETIVSKALMILIYMKSVQT